jgi:hypothetical protein
MSYRDISKLLGSGADSRFAPELEAGPGHIARFLSLGLAIAEDMKAS